MRDTSHLVALHTGLMHEKQRLSESKTQSERDLRSVWVSQIEKEIAHEMNHLGMDSVSETTLSDDELLAELS